MKKTSWLARAKTVQDLGFPVYLPKSGQQWDDARQEKAELAWLEILKRPIPVAAEYAEFFGTRMHDSWVIRIERTPQRITVTLDSIHAHIFVVDFCNEIGIERIPSQWPVQLVFHDPIYFRSARHDPEGTLRFEDIRTMRSSNPQEGDQFLYDRFFEEDGRIQWVAEVDARRREQHKLSSAAYLMIDCSRCSAVDLRAGAIEKAYGLQARAIWNDVLHGSEKGPSFDGVWGFGTMRAFIRDRVNKYGF